MKKENQWIQYAVIVVGLLLAASLMEQAAQMTANTVLQALFRGIRNVIHVSLLFGWCISIHQRILNVQIRRYLIVIGILMICWLMVKVIKWEFIASRTFWLGRYIWYSYYIPMIFIPLQGVFLVDYIGKSEDYRNPKWMKYLYIPAFVILIGIFTNDLHQLAFRFPEGIDMFDYEYSYGPVFFATMAWFVFLGIYVVFMLLRKRRVPGTKRIRIVPSFIMVGAVIFWIAYCLKIIQNIDLTVVDCLIISFLLESAILNGQFPSNKNYHVFFQASTVAAKIVDKEYQPCFTSAAAVSLARDEMKEMGEEPVKCGNVIYHSKPITGGYVFWQDDVTEINKMMNRLQKVQMQLGRENELLHAELKLKEQQVKIEEKNRLYDRIHKEAEPQLKKLDALLEMAAEPSLVHSTMVKMCVIGSYLKRRSNLLLLGEENQSLPAGEIEYCIRESLDNLGLASVYTLLETNCEGRIQLEYVLAAYDFYENVVERLWDRMNAMMVRLSCKNGELKMNFQIGCECEIDDRNLEEIHSPYGSFTCTIQEKDVIINFGISKGGGCL